MALEKTFEILFDEPDSQAAMQLRQRLDEYTLWDAWDSPEQPPDIRILLLSQSVASTWDEWLLTWGDRLDLSRLLVLRISNAEIPAELEPANKLLYVNPEDEQFIDSLDNELNRLRPAAVEQPDEQERLLPQSSLEVPEHFIGRDDLCANITGHLEADKSVLIYGFGGIGKTSIAAKIAEQWPQPVLVVECGDNTTLDESLDAMLELLGMEDKRNFKIQNKKEAIANKLAEMSVLVILDDLWEYREAQERDVDPTILLDVIPANTPLLVTSRNKLDHRRFDEACQIEVSGLPTEQANNLFFNWAGEGIQQNEQVLVKEFCQLVAGHPYAIKLAGALLRRDRDNLWDMRRLLDDVQAAPHTLEMPLGLEPEHRRNIAAVLYVSARALLPPPEYAQVFWTTGKLYAPRVTPELMIFIFHRIWNVEVELLPINRDRKEDEKSNEEDQPTSDSAPPKYDLRRLWRQDVGPALAEMVTRSLAQRIDPQTDLIQATSTALYYEFHNLTLFYAQSNFENVKQEAERDEDQEIQDAFRNFTLPTPLEVLQACAVYTHHYAREDPTAHSHLDAEWLNLYRAAMYFAPLELKAENDPTAVYKAINQMALDLWEHSRFLEYRGYWKEAIALLTLACRAAERLGEEHALDLAIHLKNLGAAYMNRWDLDDAEKFTRQAIDKAQKIPDVRIESRAWGNLGRIYADRDRDDRDILVMAIDYNLTAYRLVESSDEIDDKKWKCTILNNVGAICTYREEWFEMAKDYLPRALQLAREVGDEAAESRSLSNLGLLYEETKVYEKALMYYEQAHQKALKVSNTGDVGIYRGNIGNICQLQGQELAESSSEDNRKDARKLFGKARRYLESALKIHSAIGLAGGVAYWLKCLDALDAAVIELEPRSRRVFLRDAISRYETAAEQVSQNAEAFKARAKELRQMLGKSQEEDSEGA